MLAAAAGIILNDSIGSGQDGVGRAVILLQLDHLDAGKMFFQVQEVGRFRPAPPVNALIVVPHNAQVAVGRGQMVDELKLRGVGVLVFILVPAGRQDAGMLPE